MANYLFTSESVTEGHPDKVCDQISDAVLDAILEKDPKGHVACECTATTGIIYIMGEISTSCYVDIAKIARQVIRDIGYTRPDEFDRLLDVFARYPIHELIIHPRTRVEFYKGTPHREAFAKAHAALDRPLCYNGDLFCEEDCRELMRQFPNTRALMLGRGLIANPALAQSLGGGEALCKASLRAFHDRLLEAYQAKYPAHVTLGRMREIAKHFVCCFDAPEKPRKAIRKATRIEAYLDAIDRLFAEHELNETPRFIAE